MKKIFNIGVLLLLLNITVKADNPPYPCGTYQQGGAYCYNNKELYPGIIACYGEPYPKQSYDYWVFTDTRPGFSIFSRGWWKIECGVKPPDVPLPLDDYAPIALIIGGAFGVFVIRKTAKKYVGFKGN